MVSYFGLPCVFFILIYRVVSEPKEYCQWKTFAPDCGDEVIVIKDALYGRREYGPCIDRDYGYVGCYLNVTLMTDLRCSGRHVCQITVPDMKFDRVTPCPRDLVRYFEVDYECRPVYMAPSRCTGTRYITAPSGVIASITTNETGCGSTTNPYIISAKPGQKIAIKIIDFALKEALRNDTESGDFGGYSSNHCHVYAILKEPHAKQSKSETICGGTSRVRDVYLSKTHELEIRIMNADKKRHFLLEYTMTDCPNLQEPAGGWLHRDDDVITAGCTAGKEQWRVTCNRTQWKGHVGNCSRAVTKPLTALTTNFTQTLSIVIILVVALIIGAMIFCAGLFFIKRRRRMANGPGEVYVTTGPRPIHTKEGMYRTPNAPYNGYTPPSTATKNEGSDENDYEYVDDILRPPVAPSGEPRGIIKHQNETCAMHRGNNPYTKYGTNDNDESEHDKPPHVQVALPRNHPYKGQLSYPPQYFELDPEVSVAMKGNVYQGQTGVTAHGGSQMSTDDLSQDFDRKANFSFGHYSQ